MREKPPRLQVVGTEGKADYVYGGGIYNALIPATAEFLRTGKSPVDPVVTIEIIEFMMAAQMSSEGGRAEVLLAEVRKPPASTRMETVRRN